MTTADADSVGACPQARQNLALVGVVVALALLNSVTTGLWSESNSNVRNAIVYSLFAFEPIIFGVWTALGVGSILKRLAVAVPCLMLLFIAPGYVPEYFADLRQNEFTMAVLMGFAIYTTAVILFLIFRWFTGCRIRPASSEPHTDNGGIKFSTKDLLALITLYAVAMGPTTQLKFQTEPRPANQIFGLEVFIEILVFSGSFLSATVLPTIAVPLSILHGRPTRRAITLTIVFWVAVAVSVAFFTTDDNDFFDVLGMVLLLQMSAAIIGAVTAIALRYGGLRLTRPDRAESTPAHS